MKRILALAAALCLTLCLAMTAMAETEGLHFTIETSAEFEQQSDTEYVSSGLSMNDEPIEVTLRLSQKPRTEQSVDPYSEDSLAMLDADMWEDDYDGAVFQGFVDLPHICTLGAEGYRAICSSYSLLQGGEELQIAEYRMYSDDMVYLIRFIGDGAPLLVMGAHDHYVQNIHFGSGVEVPKGMPEPVETDAPEETDAQPHKSGPSAEELFDSVATGVLKAAVIGALSVGIMSLAARADRKKARKKRLQTLAQSETFAQDPDAFRHEGKYYNRSKYIDLRARQLSSISKSQLAKTLQKAPSAAEHSYDEAEIAALRMAYERKAD